MMRSKFDGQLALLKNELIRMGALCEEAISKAAKALEEGDRGRLTFQGTRYLGFERER